MSSLSVPLSSDPVQAERQRTFLDYYSWSIWAQEKVRSGIFVSAGDAARMELAVKRQIARDRAEAMAGYGG